MYGEDGPTIVVMRRDVVDHDVRVAAEVAEEKLLNDSECLAEWNASLEDFDIDGLSAGVGVATDTEMDVSTDEDEEDMFAEESEVGEDVLDDENDDECTDKYEEENGTNDIEEIVLVADSDDSDGDLMKLDDQVARLKAKLAEATKKRVEVTKARAKVAKEKEIKGKGRVVASAKVKQVQIQKKKGGTGIAKKSGGKAKDAVVSVCSMVRR